MRRIWLLFEKIGVMQPGQVKSLHYEKVFLPCDSYLIQNESMHFKRIVCYQQLYLTPFHFVHKIGEAPQSKFQSAGILLNKCEADNNLIPST